MLCSRAELFESGLTGDHEDMLSYDETRVISDVNTVSVCLPRLLHSYFIGLGPFKYVQQSQSLHDSENKKYKKHLFIF